MKKIPFILLFISLLACEKEYQTDQGNNNTQQSESFVQNVTIDTTYFVDTVEYFINEIYDDELSIDYLLEDAIFLSEAAINAKMASGNIDDYEVTCIYKYKYDLTLSSYTDGEDEKVDADDLMDFMDSLYVN